MAVGEEEGFAVGMDLGTSYCRVAVWKDDHVHVIEDVDGKRMMASYVAFSSTERFIGDAAESQPHTNISNTVFDTKRLIGRKFQDPYVQEDIKLWPFRVTSGPGGRPLISVKYRDIEKQFTAEEICSMLLMKMKQKAESYLGIPVKNVVITVPAYFNDSQRQATKDAAAIAGLNVMRLMNESTAAALTYSSKKKHPESERKVLIFDLGGGTLDVSVMTVSGYTFKVLAVLGNTHLGGKDFDNRLVNHFVEKLWREQKIDISGNHKALRKLRRQCEEAKRTLSFLTEDKSQIDALYEGNDFSFEITREEFEKLNLDLFVICIDTVKRCLEDAKIEANSLDDVVLVGGSTRIPMLQQMLQNLFDKKKWEIIMAKGINSDEAVVCGAATQAAILNHQLKLNPEIKDVAPFSIGFKDRPDVIPRNETIPKKTDVIHTIENGKEDEILRVYESEWDGRTYNRVGTYWVTRLPGGGTCNIKIWFSIDAEGILRVSADPTSGIRITTEKLRLVEEEIEKMGNEGKEYQRQDEDYRKTMVSRNALGTLIYKIRNKVGNGHVSSSEDKERIEKILEDTIDWLQANQLAKINEIESRKKKIEDLFNKAVEKKAYKEGRETVMKNVQTGINTSTRRLVPEEETEIKNRANKEDEDLDKRGSFPFRYILEDKNF